MSKADDLQNRTRLFAVSTIEFRRSLPHGVDTRHLTLQLIKSATSIGANFRAARRARSHAEFTAKIGLVAEEADESEYWWSVICNLSLGDPERSKALHQESMELMRIFGKSAGTARSHRR